MDVLAVPGCELPSPNVLLKHFLQNREAVLILTHDIADPMRRRAEDVHSPTAAI
jgi:hypothetical protein